MKDTHEVSTGWTIVKGAADPNVLCRPDTGQWIDLVATNDGGSEDGWDNGAGKHKSDFKHLEQKRDLWGVDI